MKNISLLGSTGSIGKNTLEVVSRHPDRFRIVGLAVNNNVEELEGQIHAFSPAAVAVFDEQAAERMRKRNLPVQILSGEEGLSQIATLSEADMVVGAIAGSDGLVPAYAAVRAGKDLALATKEALVMAGGIIMSEAARRGVRIIPVDSEHSAVFQCLNGRDMDDVEKIVLTASGGAFLSRDASELQTVTPREALKHPNWSMGRKITIDSATLMNKGLEVIEAFWLFGLPAEKIEVVLHPQSIIHSMIRFIDGSIIAHLSVPDMKGPISYALSYPGRLGSAVPALDFSEVGELTFEKPDREKYPSLDLTYRALKAGGTMPCVLNAANEVAVQAFLDEKIPFPGITGVVADTMNAHTAAAGDSIDEIIRESERARQTAQDIIDRKYACKKR